jgi:predicted nucleic acid-binding protein
MGLIGQLTGLRVCIDTAPIIYFVEQHHTYLPVVKPVFASIDAGEIGAITSTVILLEVLVQPSRTNNQFFVEKYRDILLSAENFTTFEILHEIAEEASKLRAQYALKTPDALQITGGFFTGRKSFSPMTLI